MSEIHMEEEEDNLLRLSSDLYVCCGTCVPTHTNEINVKIRYSKIAAVELREVCKQEDLSSGLQHLCKVWIWLPAAVTHHQGVVTAGFRRTLAIPAFFLWLQN